VKNNLELLGMVTSWRDVGWRAADLNSEITCDSVSVENLFVTASVAICTETALQAGRFSRNTGKPETMATVLGNGRLPCDTWKASTPK
jgi:hypothetical protein